MSDVNQMLEFFTQSVFRTAEILLAVVLLLVTGFGVWLVGMQPGSSEGGGVIVGLLLLAGAVSVLLALVVVMRAAVDFTRSVAA